MLWRILTMQSMSNKLATNILFVFIYSIFVFIITPDSKLSKDERWVKSELIHDTRLLNNYTIVILITLASLMVYSWGIVYDKFWVFHDLLSISPSMLSHMLILAASWVIVYVISTVILVLLSFAVHYICVNNLLSMIPAEYCFKQTADEFVYIVANDEYRELFNKPESMWMYNLLTFYHKLANRFNIIVELDM